MRIMLILAGALLSAMLFAGTAEAGPCDDIQRDCGGQCLGNPLTSTPGGETKGCIRAMGEQTCFGGHAIPAVGCVCVNGICANNFPDSAGPGCPNSNKPCSKQPL